MQSSYSLTNVSTRLRVARSAGPYPCIARWRTSAASCPAVSQRGSYADVIARWPSQLRVPESLPNEVLPNFTNIGEFPFEAKQAVPSDLRSQFVSCRGKHVTKPIFMDEGKC